MPTAEQKRRNLRSLLIFGLLAAAFFGGYIVKVWLFGK